MGRLFDGIINWSVRARVVVLLLAVMLVVFGILSVRDARMDVLPDFTPPRVVVQTEATQMTTPDVEELVTIPLERALLGTPDATSVRSTSFPGLSVITVTFTDGVDVLRARQVVTERIDLARRLLPKTAEPSLAPISAPIGAVLKFALTSRDASEPQAARDLRSYAEFKLQPALLAVEGVSQVTVHGGGVERIEVRPDPVRMRDHHVTLEAIVAAVEDSQAAAGVGYIEPGEERLDVQVDARLTPETAIARLKSASLSKEGESPLRLADVSEIERASSPPVGAATYDGAPAVYLQVNKLPDADALRVTRDLEAVLAAARDDLPAGVVIQPPVFRQASFIQTSIRSVARAMAIGAGLVVGVLLILLKSPRLAAISLVAIPLSILAAGLVLVRMGVTINGMTLGGLALAVGEVVDDAIVDVENVARRLRENARLETPKPAFEVIQTASREVRGSVVYATVIVCVVLLPVILLGGIAGRIFSPLAQAYVLAIVASLVVALTVTPALSAVLLSKLGAETGPTRVATWLVDRYEALLRRAIRRPALVLMPAMIATLGAAAVLPFLGGRFLPEFHEGALVAHVHAAPGTSLPASVDLANRVDASLRPEAAVHVAARAGRAELDEDAAPVHRVELDIVLPPESGEWDETILGVEKRIGAVPGVSFSVEGFLGERIHEVLSGETAPVVVKVIGPDLTTLRTIAADVTTTMEGTDGLGFVQAEPQIDVAMIRIAPRERELAAAGVSARELAEAVEAWRSGREVTTIRSGDGRVVEVVVAGSPAYRDLDGLRMIPLRTRFGASVTLSELATIETTNAPSVIQRDHGERRIAIGASPSGASLSGAVGRLERALSKKKLPSGYHVEVGGEAKERANAALRLILLGVLVLVAIFAFLATAFQSTRDAAIVLFNIPLGLIGGVVAAALTPDGLSIAGLVGFVTLFGIIARNGILLVAHKRHLDQEHPEDNPVEIVLRAARERVLPIVMTAATAGLGLLPLALSMETAGSEIEGPMALIVCGGLVTSTALNLIVLPTAYVWLARRKKSGATA